MNRKKRRPLLAWLMVLAMLCTMFPPAVLAAEGPSGGAAGPEATVAGATYSVTADSAISGGSVAVNPDSGNEGDTITVTVTPDEGKQLAAGSLKYNDGSSDTEISATEGIYSFVLPAANVTVTAQFEDIPAATYPVDFSVSGENGSLTAAVDSVAISSGDAVTAGKTVVFTAAPAAGYQVKQWTVDSQAAADNKTNTLTLENLAAATIVTVEFEAVTALIPDTAWYVGEGPYYIANANQLAGLAQLVNGGNDFEGKTVYLSNNIVLDGDGKYTATPETVFGTESYNIVTTWYAVNDDARIWTPIGTGTSTGANTIATANYFAGTFDGAGYTVSGLYTDGTARVQGLFGCVTGTVKNLTVSGCVTAHSIAGGVAAYLNGGTIENCVNNAIVFIDGGTTPNGGVESGLNKAGANGGIAGLVSGQAALPFKIADCVNNGVIIGANSWQGGRTGGIAGLVNDSNDYGSFSNCFNTEIIDAYQYAGGIVGMNYSSHAPIDRCANQAKIQAQSPGSTYVGGIVAYCSSPISNCYNTGNVNIRKEGTANTKVAHAGGIVSDLVNTTVTNCYNTGALTWEGYNITAGCSSYGSICGTGYGYVGGIKLFNCYTTVTANAEDYAYISGQSVPDALTLKTNDEMKAEAILPLLNGDGRAFVKDNAAPVNNGYPILRGQMAPADTSTVTGITKESDPAKLNYVAGQTFDPVGLAIWANYSDSTREKVADYTISKTTALETTDTLITVSGMVSGTAYSFDLPITVEANALADIAVTTQPQNVLYVAGEIFNPEGMVVRATYSNGATATLTADQYTVSPATPLTADDTKVTVSYTEGEVTKTVEQPVTVLASAAPVLNESVYELASADHMLWFANQVNANLNKEIKGKLTQDIDLSAVTWKSIGNNSSRKYAGTFDGSGKTVTLAISGAADYSGLFGYVSGGTVKDLTVAGSVYGGSYTAGIVANAEGAAVIENCVNNAAVTATSNNVGGIAGYANNTAVISGCINNGAVSGGYYVGGVVGNDYGSCTISKCANTGSITATSTATSTGYGVGGIAGYAYGATEIDQCHNSGAVNGSVRNVGGVAGYLYNASAKVTNSYNTGSVTSTSTAASTNTGGVIGRTNNAACTVQNTYNAGEINVDNTGQYTAGVIGYANSNINVSNNYYLDTTASQGLGRAADNAVRKTSAELQNLAPVLGEYFKPGSLYPIFTWQTATSPETCTVNFSVTGENGSLTAAVDSVDISSGDAVTAGKTVVFTAAPAAGYQVKQWTVDSQAAADNKTNTLTVENLVSAKTVTVEFETASATAYTVTIDDSISGGSVAVNPGSGNAGDTVIVTVTPGEGKQLAAGSLKYNDGSSDNEITATDSVYSFVLPAANVTVTAQFEDIGGGTGIWDGTTITEVNESDASGGAGLGYYCISTGSQLAWLAQEVNSGNDFSGKTILLLDDIDLGGHEWIPIGQGSFTLIDLGAGDDRYGETAVLNQSGHTMFKGLFDGGGYTITGLSVSQGNGVALFGYLGETGKIQSLTVSGSVHGNHFVSGVAAICGGDLEDITNQVVVSAEGNFVGGVAAEGVDSINITNCHNRAYISNSSNTRSSGRLAGIIGRVDTNASAQITLCSNTGEIYGYQYVGGIIGGSFGDVNVSYCYNTANLTGVSFGKVYLGGIAGKLQSGTISYCYNTGDLHDAHWAAGHIRAIGGIAGCEEDHPSGTAITNCYTTGAITVNTSNMSYGTNWIYMFGNISGGNSATGGNTMGYENCYYLEGRIAIADPEHESYRFWSDIYKNNPLIWDTEYITSSTEAQMKSEEFLSGFTGEGYFVADGDNINDGYPILYWQSGQSEPEPTWYSISKEVIGSGAATVSFSADSAVAGTTITLSVSGLAPDKMIRKVDALDTAGRAIPVATVSENSAYTFIMPARNVSVSVTVENRVTPGAMYLLTIPEGLDAIWSVAGDSTYAAGGKVTAGASVFLTVDKAADACMTSFEGVQITTDSGSVDYQTLSYKKDSLGSGVSGVYLFTMPSADVTVSLEIDYAELSVYTQDGQYGAQTLKKIYTRDDMLALAELSPLYYSGYYSETEPFIGKAEQAVTLTRLLTDAGTELKEGSQLEVGSIDGMNLYFTYDKLYGSQRYYYPNLISGKNAEEKAEGKTPVDMLLIIKGYFARAAEGSVEDYTCDTLNAYRFVFGQNETEFNNGIPAVGYKAVDKMSKYVSKLVVINPTGSSGSGDVNAPVWDGYSLDVSWFDKDAYDTTDKYYISTPAQLAGLAAIVNGIYNAEIDTFAGDTGSIVANWTEADTDYCMGSYDFEGKTVYLTADIDMSGGNYMPVGGQYLMVKNNHLTNIGSSFNGTFDGQGHSVTIVCDRHCSDGDYKAGSSVGLIGRLGVHDGDPTDWRPVNPTVRKVAVYGSIHANRSVGGIVGKIGKTAANNSGNNDDGGIIENCANFASVSNTDSKGCGGIVGAGWNGGIVRNCYNAGNISSTYACPTGGISGSNEIILENCYNAGNISAAADRFAMGIGTNNSNLAPYSSKVINCWYLQGSAPGGGYFDSKAYNDNALTEAEMKSEDFLRQLGSAFAGDTMNNNNGYPVLVWQGAPAPDIYNVTVDGSISGGTVAVNPAGAAAGETVTVTVTPGPGKRLAADSLKYNDGSGDIEITETDGIYSFTMPAADVTVTARFEVSPVPQYMIAPVEDESVYEAGETGGIKTMTVKAGVSGLKYFVTQIAPVIEHEGREAVVFVHLRGGVQLSLNITKADFDLVDEAQAGFNVQDGDVVKVYIVDDLTNDTDFNPTVLQ